MPGQQGRTVLVTGANDGLGALLAEAFAGKGARVVMACRNLDKAEDVRRDIALRWPIASLEIVPLDLGDLASVAACAEAVSARCSTLDVLMCNAGVMAVPFGLTRDGFERQMGVNYYGHFAFVGRLMPVIRRTPGARVVTTASVAEKWGRLDLAPPSAERYQRWRSYCDSKLAMLMLGLMLNERFQREGIDAKGASAHPGYARTHLRTTRLATERSRWQRFLLHVFEAMSMPAERGVLPLLYAATWPEIAGGEYVGVDGLGEVRGWPKITRGQRRAYDPELRRRLWEHSTSVTHVRY